MTPQTSSAAAPASPFFTSVTETDKNGNVTPVYPGALVEFATQATANKVLAVLTKEVPEGMPYSIVSQDTSFAGQKWSEPQYAIQSANLQQFNAGLVFQEICWGGYDKSNTLSQIRSAVTA